AGAVPVARLGREADPGGPAVLGAEDGGAEGDVRGAAGAAGAGVGGHGGRAAAGARDARARGGGGGAGGRGAEGGGAAERRARGVGAGGAPAAGGGLLPLRGGGRQGCKRGDPRVRAGAGVPRGPRLLRGGMSALLSGAVLCSFRRGAPTSRSPPWRGERLL